MLLVHRDHQGLLLLFLWGGGGGGYESNQFIGSTSRKDYVS